MSATQAEPAQLKKNNHRKRSLSKTNSTIMANRFQRSSRQHFHKWTIGQLNLQPYQHVLEIGYGSGQLLAMVARTLRIGFLAGIESSILSYQQAYRHNKAFIGRQLIQLHLGELHELPYPAHYFHTIYGSSIDFSRKDPITACLRLASMLRIGGRLFGLAQASSYHKEEDLRIGAIRLQAACLTAGLTDIHTEYGDFPSGPGVAVTGFKSDSIGYEPYRSINNRLLNSWPHFISNNSKDADIETQTSENLKITDMKKLFILTAIIATSLIATKGDAQVFVGARLGAHIGVGLPVVPHPYFAPRPVVYGGVYAGPAYAPAPAPVVYADYPGYAYYNYPAWNGHFRDRVYYEHYRPVFMHAHPYYRRGRW